MLREPLAIGQVKKAFEGPGTDRMARQAPDRAHKVLERPGWPDVIYALHEGEEIGPKMLARMAKHTGLKPEDL